MFCEKASLRMEINRFEQDFSYCRQGLTGGTMGFVQCIESRILLKQIEYLTFLTV